MRTYPLSLMLSAALLVSGSLFAADTNPEPAVKTILKLKKSDGAVESLRFDDALAVGQSRGYETDAGTPVLVTRTEAGLRIEMPEKTVTIALPAPGDTHHGVVADVEKQVRIEGDGESADDTRVVVMRRRGDASIDDTAIEALIDADPETLAELHGDGDGERKVVIVRKRVDEQTAP